MMSLKWFLLQGLWSFIEITNIFMLLRRHNLIKLMF